MGLVMSVSTCEADAVDTIPHRLRGLVLKGSGKQPGRPAGCVLLSHCCCVTHTHQQGNVPGPVRSHRKKDNPSILND